MVIFYLKELRTKSLNSLCLKSSNLLHVEIQKVESVRLGVTVSEVCFGNLFEGDVIDMRRRQMLEIIGFISILGFLCSFKESIDSKVHD